MLVIDLFSGLGGFSKAFKEAGDEVLTFDNNPKFRADFSWDLANYEAAIRILRGIAVPDVLLASPPCVEFSKANMPRYPDIVPDMALVHATKKIIDAIEPKTWVVENVRGAVPYFADVFGTYAQVCGSRYLWGNFPKFPCNHRNCCGKQKVPPGALRTERGAKVPYEISYNLRKAIMEAVRC